MPDVRLFRNDGDEMFADDPGTLDYVDPGIVLLYADTDAGVLCSYLEGRLGQPIQATAECRFEDGIDVTAVRPAVEALDRPGFSVATATDDDFGHARWALDGLAAEPLAVGDSELDAIRRLVDETGSPEESGILDRLPVGFDLDRSPRDLADGRLLAAAEASNDGSDSPERSDGRDGQATDGGSAPPRPASARSGASGPSEGGAGLDFATRSTYDAARFFAFLVDALRDTGATIAVSKAGRVDAVADADVVIRPDGELEKGSRIDPLAETQERIDVEREHVTRGRVRGHLTEPVDDLIQAYQDALTEPGVDVDDVDPVLQKLLNAEIRRDSTLAVVDRWRARYRRVRLALVGLLLGVVAGVLGAEELRLAGWHVETKARSLATTDLTTVRGLAVDAVGGQRGIAAVAVAGTSAVVLVGALALRRRRKRSGHSLGGDSRPSTARGDLVRIALNVVTVGALLALVASSVLLWTVA